MKTLIYLLLLLGAAITAYSLFEIRDSQIQVEERKEAAVKMLNEVTEKKLTFEQNETIGLLSVPKINKDIPIIEGTDNDQLAAGVGHFTGTAFPGQKDQIVLSGHRDTVFRKFDQLKVGDIFTVKLSYGDFSYEIYDTKIVDADDLSIIKSTSPEEVLTVTTCYPFNFIGDAPERFIFYARPKK
ncbi:class D sortase [Cytobacillus oceanisediminis]|uniref:class D sortase n=1 Tax=Cytobacillus oceanisediminis TaxID=665099 RepID=UPI0023DB036E|nr:class D sortase [Cytobacillus oceanisediminis]MDF2037706.1 class D sortase [Cytobacillus oceanisediminis]